MKRFGSLTRLANLIFRKSGFDVTVQPLSASGSTVFQLPDAAGGTHAILTNDSTATLTNKTYDAAGTGNTLSNVANTNIAAAAAIAFSKLASLSTGQVIAGNGGVATAVTVSGDVTISSTGDVQIASGVIVNADINASAAIALTKLAALSSHNRALVSDGSGFIVESAVTSTELGYLSGVTSSVQSQLDAISTGADWKASVRVASAGSNLTLSGAQTIDGISAIAGDRVLVKDQTLGKDNGIYVVASGAWARSSDADTSPKVTASLAVFVSEGSTQADSAWILTTDDPITLGTTPLVFTKFANFGSHASLSGLGADDHTQYALLAGRSGGQILYGSTAATQDLALRSTSNGTKNLVKVDDGSVFAVGPNVNDALSFYQGLSVPLIGELALGIYGNDSDAEVDHFVIEVVGNAANPAPSIAFGSARSSDGTYAGMSGSGFLLTNDAAMRIDIAAFGGTYPTEQEVAKILAIADEDHSSGHFGTSLRFSSTAVAASSAVEHLRISDAVRIMGSSQLYWNTDGGGNIGNSSANRPNQVFVKDSLYIGDTSGLVFLQSSASISSLGTNQDLTLSPNGSGSVALPFGNNLHLLASNNTDFVGFKAPSSLTSVTYQLPPAPGTSGFVLSSTTGGVMSWVSNSSVSSAKFNWTDNTFTATISNASPGVVTATAHGLVNGQAFYFTTTGTLPTGLSPNVIYYVVSTAANTFQVAATYGGSAINTSSGGSGTHTVNVTSYAASHSLATQDIIAQAFDIASGFQVEFDEVIRVSTSLVIFNGTELPGGSGFRLMLLAT